MLTQVGLANPKADIEATLDDFHLAASQADAARYFGHFTDDAVFLGTDLKERWTLEQFKAYAMPHFNEGRGWTYKAVSRHVFIASDGQTAWFDEVLNNDKFGQTRGTGVLVKSGQRWRLAQYHLTLPIPNELIEQVVQQINKQP